jgi:catechol 2,3-dioxygenase-like lactoylglutathione lyase family enzyme
MSTADVSVETATRAEGAGVADLKLEVVVLPVADVDRARQFYEQLGWRLDAAFAAGDFRVVQLTPPGSPTAIIFGAGVTDAAPGSVDGLVLAVDDVEVARAALAARGVDVSEVFHDAGGVFYHAGERDRVPGPDPERRSYGSWASFTDPDGNRWMLQEITTRLPGRVDTTDVATLAELLRETAEQHDGFEKASAPHHWWDWYAPYLSAREQGHAPEAATAAADRYMEEQRGVARR